MSIYVSQAGNKRTMARRAIELGLEPAADQVLTTPLAFNPTVLIQKGEKGKETNADIETGKTHCFLCIVSLCYVPFLWSYGVVLFTCPNPHSIESQNIFYFSSPA